MKEYKLTVYIALQRWVATILAECTFTDYMEMVKYCATFCTENLYINHDVELIFDVWTAEDGQFNIRDDVNAYRDSIEQNGGNA